MLGLAGVAVVIGRGSLAALLEVGFVVGDLLVLAAVVGGGLAVAGNTLLARFIFNLEPGLSWGVLAGGVLSVCLVTVVTGFLTNRGITRHPPLEVLRQET